MFSSATAGRLSTTGSSTAKMGRSCLSMFQGPRTQPCIRLIMVHHSGWEMLPAEGLSAKAVPAPYNVLLRPIVLWNNGGEGESGELSIPTTV